SSMQITVLRMQPTLYFESSLTRRSSDLGRRSSPTWSRTCSATATSTARPSASTARCGWRRNDRLSAMHPGHGPAVPGVLSAVARSEEHTSELQSRENLVCRLALDKQTNR